jgi:hypothetical protein
MVASSDGLLIMISLMQTSLLDVGCHRVAGLWRTLHSIRAM